MEKFLTNMPWSILIIACLTLGLAPFHPPHLWEKLQLLAKGQLVRPLDWFDLLLHGSPWLLLAAKAVFALKTS
ncbi:MAG: RND transporter [Deltaproteobacteria bacterium]|nr:RND transporter [Deltaproteobacteria bacterium]